MKTRTVYYWCIIAVVSILAFEGGCNRHQQLGGQVAFPDGAPLEYGTIYFATDTYLARAVLGPGGRYDVSSYKDGDGLPPGNYKVYIVGAVAEGTGEVPSKPVAAPAVAEEPASLPTSATSGTRPATAAMRLLIDPKYTRMETTPLQFTIPGEKTFHFTVEPPTR